MMTLTLHPPPQSVSSQPKEACTIITLILQRTCAQVVHSRPLRGMGRVGWQTRCYFDQNTHWPSLWEVSETLTHIRSNGSWEIQAALYYQLGVTWNEAGEFGLYPKS
jgi:hypothetical protein